MEHNNQNTSAIDDPQCKDCKIEAMETEIRNLSAIAKIAITAGNSLIDAPKNTVVASL